MMQQDRKPKYRIAWDGIRVWQIEQRSVNKKTGEDQWSPCNYFGRIDACCQTLLQLEAGRRTEWLSIAEAFKEASQFVKDELHRIEADQF